MTSLQLMSPSNYEILEIIGGGTYGAVQKVRIKETGEIFAMKEIILSNCDDETSSNELLEDAKAEYELLRKNMKNVVQSRGSFYDKEKERFFFSMNYYPKNLATFMRESCGQEKSGLPFNEFLPIFKDILTGLHSLFKDANTIHRDLKPENILIDNDRRALIADLGVAKRFESTIQAKHLQSIYTIVGTKSWMAPEMVKLKQSMDFRLTNLSKLDIFSLGMIAMSMLDQKTFAIHRKEFNSNEYLVDDFLCNNIRGKVPRNFYYVLRCMLSFSPATRPSLSELYEDIVRKNFISVDNEAMMMSGRLQTAESFLELGYHLSEETSGKSDFSYPDNLEKLGLRNWELEKLQRVETIQQGDSIDVLKMKRHYQRDLVRAKFFKFNSCSNFEEKQRLFQKFLKEKNIMESLGTISKDYFAEFLGAFYSLNGEDRVEQVILLTESGDFTLKELLAMRKNNKQRKDLSSPFEPDEALNIIYHIAKALSLLQNKKISHNNICLENIVLSKSRKTYLLMDFGRSFVLTSQEGASLQLSEEELSDLPAFYDEDKHPYGLNPYKAQIYSLGGCLKLMIEGYHKEHACLGILNSMLREDWKEKDDPVTFAARLEKMGLGSEALSVEKEIFSIMEDRRISQEGFIEPNSKHHIFEARAESVEEVLADLNELRLRMRSGTETETDEELKNSKEIFWRLGLAYERERRHHEAREAFEKFYKFQKEEPGPKASQELANTLHKISDQCQALNDTRSSLDCLYEVEAILKKAFNTNEHQEVAKVQREIANLWGYIGEHRKAVQLLQSALRLQTRIFKSEEELDVAETLNAIAMQLRCMRDFESSLEHLKKAKGIEEKILGSEHLVIASSEFQLGIVYQKIGKYDDAQRSFESALRIQQKNYKDEENEMIASSISQIASVLSSKGKYKEALEKYSRALLIQRKCFKTEQKKPVANTYKGIGEQYFLLQENEAALENFRKSLELTRLISQSPENRETVFCLKRMGEIYLKSGKLDLAAEFLEEALKISRGYLNSHEHEDFVHLNRLLGEVWSARNDLEKSLACFSKALEIEIELKGQGHPDSKKLSSRINELNKLLRPGAFVLSDSETK